MSVASLNLCKQLYELSGWQDVDESIFSSVTEKLDWIYDAPSGLWWLPAYDAGYLLRKLPHFIQLTQLSGGYTPNGWRAEKNNSQDFAGYCRADAASPEDALCLLAIELFKSGVLKREDEK